MSRSYVYDQETKLYYLQSRYYDPEVGRFLNADGFTTTGQGFVGNNMFAYCCNNPLTFFDPSGNFGFITAIIVTGAVVGGLLGAFNAVATGGNVVESVVEGAITGAVSSACGMLIANTLIAVAVAAVGGAVVDLATQATTQYIEEGTVDPSKIDAGRVVKTAAQTAVGTAVPQIGNAAGDVVDAVGTAVLWAEASTLIVAADVIVTNVRKMKNRSTYQRAALYDDQKLLVT